MNQTRGEESLILHGPPRRIDQDLMIEYTNTLGFRNPIHYKGDFSEKSEYGGPIASGPFALALLDDLMLSLFPNSWLTGGQLSVAFLAPVRPDDVIRAEARVKAAVAKEEQTCLVFEVRCISSGGVDVMGGTASVYLT